MASIGQQMGDSVFHSFSSGANTCSSARHEGGVFFAVCYGVATGCNVVSDDMAAEEGAVGVTFFSTGPCSGPSFRGCNRTCNVGFGFFRAGLGRSATRLTRNCSNIYTFIGSAIGTTIVSVLTRVNIGTITLHYTKFGGISVGRTSKHVRIVQIPTCSPCTITRRTVTLLLASVHHVRGTCVHSHSFGFDLRGLANFSLRNGAINIMNANHVKQIFVSVYHNFNVQILTCSGFPTPKLSGNSAIHCMSVPRLLTNDSVVSLRYPLARSACRLVSSDTLTRYGAKMILVGASHKTLISTRTLLTNVGSHGIKTTYLSICRRRSRLFFRSGSNRVLRSSALTQLVSVPGIVIASRRTFLARRTLRGVTRIAMRGLIGLFRGNSYRGRLRCRGWKRGAGRGRRQRPLCQYRQPSG